MASERPTPPAPPPPSAPQGLPRFAWFDGILEGPRGDEAAPREIARRLEAAGLEGADVQVEGGRFSLLFDAEPIPGDKVSGALRDEVAQALQQLLDALPRGGAVESTLRCTEVYENETRETLFGLAGRTLHVVARTRPVSARDQERDPARREVVPPMALGRPALVVLAILFLAAAGIFAWQSGYLDRLLGTSVEKLEMDTGPFQGLLVMDRTTSWGRYEIEIRRGPRYPNNPEETRRLLDAAASSAERAAVNAVADGSDVWLRVEDGDGEVLQAAEVGLRALIGSGEGVASVSVDGQIGARVLRLALDSGKKR